MVTVRVLINPLLKPKDFGRESRITPTPNPRPKTKKKQIGHHARPRRASATAPLRTGADTCKTGSGAGKHAGARSDPVRRRSSHAWKEDQAGKRKGANIDAVGGWRVHTADDTPSRNAATRSKHCNFMCQGKIRPRVAAGSSRNGTAQAVAVTTGVRLVGNAVSLPEQHCLRVVRPGTHPEEDIPEEGQCYRAVQARDTLAFKQQMLNVAPSVLPSRLSPRSRTKTRT